MKQLNKKVRDLTLRTRGKLAGNCGWATGELVMASGGKLVGCFGFFGIEATHNWAMDPETNDIYDPTMEQFVPNFVPVIKAGTKLHSQYMGTPWSETKYWAHRALSMVDMGKLDMFLRYKEQSGKLTEVRGFTGSEIKTSKKGDQYLLVQRQVDLSPMHNRQIRSAVAFRSKSGGYNIGVLHQMMLLTKTGKVIFPTRKVHYHIPASEKLVIRKDRGKWNDPIMMRDLCQYDSLELVVRAVLDWGKTP